MKIFWFIKYSDLDVLDVKERNIISLSPNKIIYYTKKYKIIKKVYQVTSKYNIFDYFVDTESQNILLMLQNGDEGDELIPLPLKQKEGNITEIYREMSKAQDILNNKNFNIVKNIVTDFIKVEYQKRENLIVWYRELFNHFSRIGELAISSLNTAITYLETELGHDINKYNIESLRRNMISQIREELQSVKNPEDIIKAPLLGSEYNNEIINNNSKFINNERNYFPTRNQYTFDSNIIEKNVKPKKEPKKEKMVRKIKKEENKSSNRGSRIASPKMSHNDWINLADQIIANKKNNNQSDDDLNDETDEEPIIKFDDDEV